MKNLKDFAYLVCVDPLSNQNKFYKISHNDDDSIDIEYGRIGEEDKAKKRNFLPHTKNFKELYDKQIRFGYEDNTAVFANKEKFNAGKAEELSYEDITDTEINDFVTSLINSCRAFMKENYTISEHEISHKMVAETQNHINELVDIVEFARQAESEYQHVRQDDFLQSFNKELVSLFSVSKRKMDNVADHTAKSATDFIPIIEREQEMLDNIKGQLVNAVEFDNDKQQKQKKSGTVLDAYGMNVTDATYKQEDEIVAHLGRDYGHQSVERRFIKAYVVDNEKTRTAFEKFKKDHDLTEKDCRFFYHGSKTENWWSIMKQGLSLNPDAKVTGKMFGNGLYFAPDARKSLNYMDVKGSIWNDGKRKTGFMAVYEVSLGKCYEPTKSLSSTFSANNLKDGCLSVFADKNKTCLENDEYVVYNQDQCTIKYLLEMGDTDCRELRFNLDRKALRNELIDAFDSLYRTPDGVRGQLILENLSESALREVNNKILNQNFDITEICFDYNIRRNTMEFACKTADGELITIYPDVTGDDMKFLCREMKKAFAESEKEWKSLMNKAQQCRTGELVIHKVERQADLIKEQQSLDKAAIGDGLISCFSDLIKTDKGVCAELCIDNMSQVTINEIADKVLKNASGVTNVYLNCDLSDKPDNDCFYFTYRNSNGEINRLDKPLIAYDMKYVIEEFKKAYSNPRKDLTSEWEYNRKVAEVLDTNEVVCGNLYQNTDKAERQKLFGYTDKKEKQNSIQKG